LNARHHELLFFIVNLLHLPSSNSTKNYPDQQTDQIRFQFHMLLALANPETILFREAADPPGIGGNGDIQAATL
jgi:hypothetical protein